MADNRPPKPFGLPYSPGETYIDTVTGQTKQVGTSGSDVVVNVRRTQKNKTKSGESQKSKSVYDTLVVNYQDSSDLLAQAQELLKGYFPTGTNAPQYTDQKPAEFLGVPVTQSELNSIIGKLEKQNAADKKVLDKANSKINPLEDEAKKLQSEIANNTDATEEEIKAGDRNYTPEQVKKLQDRIVKIQADIEEFKTTGAIGKKKATEPSKPAAPQPQQETTPARQIVAETLTPGMKAAGVVTPEAAKIGTPQQVTAAPKETITPTTTTKQTVAAKNPSARNRIGAGAPTATGGGTGVAGTSGGATANTVTTGKGAKSKVKVDEDKLRKQFPGYSWVFDLGPEHQDTKDLYTQMLLGPENGGITMERFQALLPQSSWFNDQRVVSTKRKISSMFGNVGLASGSMAKLVNDAIQFKYDDTELSQAFYNEVFQRNSETGGYVNESAARTALNGTDASTLRKFAKSMFMLGGDPNAMNGDIEDVLTGKMSQEDWQRTIRTTAKGVYSNWADVLDDPNMTMERLTAPWKNVAAQVLEMDPSQIDMSKPEYAAAFNGVDANGKPKSMSLGEWTVKLRTDPNYGWKNTQSAKQEARNIAYNLAVAFGKIV